MKQLEDFPEVHAAYMNRSRFITGASTMAWIMPCHRVLVEPAWLLGGIFRPPPCFADAATAWFM